MDPHHFNFHLNHAQAMQHHQPAPTSSPPQQSVPGMYKCYLVNRMKIKKLYF